MSASVEAPNRLEGDKAKRIIAAMRASVGSRGAAASTFDQVARQAGVSRGLLHYYFGSKDRLLVEVVRHDCAVRIKAMDDALVEADTLEAVVDALVRQLEAYVEEEPGSQAVIYEMLSASRHSEDIQAALAEVYTQWRAQLAEALRAKEREGVVHLAADADAVASVLFALGDGIAVQMYSDPKWDSGPAFDVGIATARRLLGG